MAGTVVKSAAASSLPRWGAVMGVIEAPRLPWRDEYLHDLAANVSMSRETKLKVRGERR